jgi:Mrp family chromosome partitioning ATPase
MEEILNEISSAADMIIIDTPPSLVSDATILSVKVDGVILVIQSGKTKVNNARAALEQLNRAEARVLGVVLNRIPKNRADYYGDYQNYSKYYKSDSIHTEVKEV